MTGASRIAVVERAPIKCSFLKEDGTVFFLICLSVLYVLIFFVFKLLPKYGYFYVIPHNYSKKMIIFRIRNIVYLYLKCSVCTSLIAYLCFTDVLCVEILSIF